MCPLRFEYNSAFKVLNLKETVKFVSKRLRTQILKKEKVTLKFLAKELGLDISTICEVLNNKPDFAKSTCERVQKFTVEAGYRSNREICSQPDT